MVARALLDSGILAGARPELCMRDDDYDDYGDMYALEGEVSVSERHDTAAALTVTRKTVGGIVVGPPHPLAGLWIGCLTVRGPFRWAARDGDCAPPDAGVTGMAGELAKNHVWFVFPSGEHPRPMGLRAAVDDEMAARARRRFWETSLREFIQTTWHPDRLAWCDADYADLSRKKNGA